MKEIPSVILKGYSELLEKRSVTTDARAYYLKWLRYYLDYCAKYNLSAKSSKSLTQFLQKLKEKEQAEFQQKQAGHAVFIYLDMERANARIAIAGKATAPVQPCPCDPMPPGAGQTSEAPKPDVIDQTPSPKYGTAVRQPLTFKEYSATGATKAQWQKAISEMTAVIKTKHYSSKTLKSYSHWAWKFQSYSLLYCSL